MTKVTNSTMTESNGDSLSHFLREFGEGETIEQVRHVRRMAMPAEEAAGAQGLDVIARIQAAELKVRAERKVGGMLAALALQGGERKSHDGDRRLRLRDFGVSRKDSSRLAASRGWHRKYLISCRWRSCDDWLCRERAFGGPCDSAA